MSSPVESSGIQGCGQREAHASISLLDLDLVESRTFPITCEENLTMASLPHS